MGQQDLTGLRIDRKSGPGKQPASRSRLVIAALLLLVVTAAAILAIRGRTLEVETVTVSRVYPTQGFSLLNASGYVVAQRKAEVAAKVTGRLEWLGVEEGDRVAAGQVLARLENRDAAASREQAAARLSAVQAEREQTQAELRESTLLYGRQKQLLAGGIVSQADFDAAEARHQRARAADSAAASAILQAQAALRGAEVSLDYTLIRAPFNGVVLTKNADVGDIVTPIGAAASAKASVVSMADMGSLLVEVDVAEANVAKVRHGQPCEITLDALPDVRFPGTVHMVIPTADRSKASVMVKVRFREMDPRILPEMSAKVAFLSREPAAADLKPALALPSRAVLGSAGDRHVYLVREGRAVRTIVTTGKEMGDLLEITSGVAAGDKVIVSPLDRVKDGNSIRASNDRS